MKKIKKTLITLVILFLVTIGMMTREVEYKQSLVDIKKGSTTETIARNLKESKLIRSEIIFRALSKLNRYDGTYRYGVVEIESDMTFDEMAKVLQKGGLATNVKRFTIPEGYTIDEMIDKLEKENVINRENFLAALNGNYDYEFLKDERNRTYKLEGYLFPDTYEIYENASEKDIIVKMLNRFDRMYKEEYKLRAKELGYTFDEIVTIASIIEKEVKKKDERKIVSGIIYNRLNINMKLEMCSTVQYLIEEKRSRLLFADLEIDSPYNTYMYAGLPKGPVGNPGEEAIKAALFPQANDYLFFTRKSIETGEHHFSTTLEEHNWAKTKYYNT